jgi:ABC-type nitrate/sulfonate/bicarbonate transport system substrate-binding protein
VILLSAARTGLAADTLEVLKVGFTIVVPNLQEMDLYLARDLGIFKKRGLDVQITPLNGDTLGLQALVSGDVDVSFNSHTLVYTALEKAPNIRIIAETMPIHDYILVTTKDITKWSDLEGKVLGISGLGGIAHLIPQMAMKRNGVDPAKVNYAVVGGSAGRAKAMTAGRTQAGMLHVIEAEELLAQNKALHIFADLRKELPGFQYVGYIALAKTIGSRRPALQKFVDGLIEAKRLLLEKKSLTVEQFLKYHPTRTEALVSQVYDTLKPTMMLGINGGMDKDPFEFTQGLMLEAGQLKQRLQYEQVYDRSFVESTLGTLGRK